MAALRLGPAACDPSVCGRLSAAFCCAAALSVIVVVTSVAASAGAVTVLLMPLLAQLTHRLADARG